MDGAQVQQAVAGAVEALRAGRERDWSAPAGELTWDCWETAEHTADDLFAYAAQLAAPAHAGMLPFALAARRPGGARNTITVDPAAGPDGLLACLSACGGLLAAVVRTADPHAHGHHTYGPADPSASAAMGILETIVHTGDVAAGLDVPYRPDDALCRGVLDRLLPDVPTDLVDTDPWAALRWATGRIALPGHPRRTRWRWFNDTSVR